MVFLYHAVFDFYFFRVVKSMEVVEGKAKNELSDDMLDNVSGGFTDRDPGWFWQMRYKFYKEDIEKLKKEGYTKLPSIGKEYDRDELEELLGIKSSCGQDVINLLHGMGLSYEGSHSK